MSLTRDDTRSRLRPFGLVFEKTLHDLIRGIRSSKDPVAREKYLKDALADCRTEARSPDMETKTMAILKLAYLEMYGYDMSWASFHVLEVMSCAKFQQKRVGYLAAIQSFRTDTDVLMLTTNLLKKDLGSAQPLEVSVALSGVATIVTPSLAQDLSDDIIKMLNHSRPYIRKKAVLAMYKVFLQFPEALRTAFPRLKEKLEDPDPSVVSATVNVICELAKQTTSSSKTFLALAPQLYELLTTSHNNWMLIKILKLFSSLAPTEPRLKPKLLPPILQQIESTTAMSLLYECINCIVTGGMLDESDYELAALCVGKLRSFLEQSDQNLKYVGLLALSKIVKLHPQFVSDHEDIILECIDDPDLTIRERVLDLVSGVINEDNIYSIVTKLLEQLRQQEEDLPRSFRIEVINKIISLCSKNTYSYLPDFEWYITILVELVQLSDGLNDDSVGTEIGEQLRNVSVRVKSVREDAVAAAAQILASSSSPPATVIPCAVWVVGEYASYLQAPVEVINTIVNMHDDQKDASVSAACIQAVVKIYANCTGDQQTEWSPGQANYVKHLTETVIKYLEKHSTAADFEVQERAVEFLELFKLVTQAIDEHPSHETSAPLLLTLAVPSMFNLFELNPIAPNSQRKIAVPEDLDLDTPIYPRCDYFNSNLALEFGDSGENSDVEYGGVSGAAGSGTPDTVGEEWIPTETPEEIEKRKAERLERQRDDPFYIQVPSNSETPIRSTTPTLSLNQSSSSPNLQHSNSFGSRKGSSRRKAKVEIAQDEMIEGEDNSNTSDVKRPLAGGKKSLLQVSSRLADLNLEEDPSKSEPDDKLAAAEAERLRSEYLKNTAAAATVSGDSEVAVTHKKIKKKKKKVATSAEGEESTKKRKKKKKKPVAVEDEGAAGVNTDS